MPPPTVANKDYLEAAAQILNAESYHASSIRFQVIAKGIKLDPLDGKDKVPTRHHVFPVDKDGLTGGRLGNGSRHDCSWQGRARRRILPAGHER